MTCGIYKITNTVTGDCYVGMSPDIESRWKAHIKAWRSSDPNYECKYLMRDVERHGITVYTFDVLEECNRDLLYKQEKEWMRNLEPTLNVITFKNGKRVKGMVTPRDAMPARPSRLGNRVKEIVDSRNISVYRFCEDTGISKNTGYRLYNDRFRFPDKVVIARICCAYNLTPRDVLFYDPSIVV